MCIRDRWAGAALGLLLLAGLLTAGAVLWRLSGSGPSYRALDTALWQQAAAAPAGEDYPRRHMAYAAQDWLDAEHPTATQVHRRLGPADAHPAPDTEAYRVGCGFTAPECRAEDWLLLRYAADGRVEETSFQPAGVLPPSAAE